MRPWLTSAIDDGTRALVGWAIALTPHTGTVLTAIRMGLVTDPARGPFGAVPELVRSVLFQDEAIVLLGALAYGHGPQYAILLQRPRPAPVERR